MMRFRLILLALLAMPHTAMATPLSLEFSNPLVADISQTSIDIRTSFNGAQLLIFGARNAPGDMVIVMRGPESDVRIRRKERIAGMWMHVEQKRYNHLPLFFAMASTKPLNEILPEGLRSSLTIGTDKIIEATEGKNHPLFDIALTETLAKKQWWQQPFGHISYFGESLFKARLDLPDSLPAGDYTVEIYLVRGGLAQASQIIPVKVSKVGLEAALVKHASRHAEYYGLAAIFMALCGGWIAHRLFHR